MASTPFAELPGLLSELRQRFAELDEHPGASFARHGGALSGEARRKWLLAEHRLAAAEQVLASYEAWLEQLRTLEFEPSATDVASARHEVLAAMDDVDAALAHAGYIELVRTEHVHRVQVARLVVTSEEQVADVDDPHREPSPSGGGPPRGTGTGAWRVEQGEVSAGLQATVTSLGRIRRELELLESLLGRLSRLVKLDEDDVADRGDGATTAAPPTADTERRPGGGSGDEAGEATGGAVGDRGDDVGR